VTRPERQLKVLKEKIAEKATRRTAGKGKRAKRWKKWADKYQSLVA
jgi:hypothetical protein